MEGRRDATRVDRADETTDDEKSLPSQETTVEGGREGGSGAITYTMGRPLSRDGCLVFFQKFRLPIGLYSNCMQYQPNGGWNQIYHVYIA